MRFQDFATGTNGVGAEFNLSAGTISSPAAVIGAFTSPSATISDVGGGWYRCTVTGTANTTQCSLRIETCTSAGAFYAAFFQGSSYAGDGSSYFDSWGYQLELGSFATSYIPTHTAAVTRSADVCQITGTDFSGFWNATEGTFVAEWDFIRTTGGTPFTALSTTSSLMQIYRSGTPDLRWFVYNGTTQADFTIGNVASVNRAAVAYKANDFAGSSLGGVVATDTSGSVPTANKLNILADENNAVVTGHISRLRYYNTRLANSKLQELST
jgi:hypothetical protein